VLYPYVKQWLARPDIVLWALAVGGVVMIVLERWLLPRRRRTSEDPVHLTYGTAFLIGAFQALALIPGVSRSASTIIGGLVAGLSRSAAVQFSFLLALPTMVAATGLDMYQNAYLFSSEQFGMLVLGAAVACGTAIIAMRWLLRYLERHDLTAFGVYRIGLAVIFWLLVL
jgi:undecaprenyl-diphosphatase